MKVKVLGIVCSPRKGGNTEILVRESLTSAGEKGAETELLSVSGKDIKPCDGCNYCLTKGECHIKDDMTDIYPKILAADAIIWGTPVYIYNVTAQAKILIDRTYAFRLGAKLKNKVGGVISVASSMGHTGVRTTFSLFFSTFHMFQADFVYGFARIKGDIVKDRHAMQSARELGKQVVLMVKQQYRFPEEYDVTINKFVEREYGIDRSPAAGRFKE